MSLKSKLKKTGMFVLATPLLYGIGWLAVNGQKANPANQANLNPNSNLETRVVQEASAVEANEPNRPNYVVRENTVRENVAEANAVEENITKESFETEIPKVYVPQSYTPQECKELQNILYAEAANQSSYARKTVARIILNRVNSNEYPDNLHDVIFERNAFSCISDRRNKNWKQATGKIKRNGYEEKVYRECGEDAKAILDGEKLGFDRENETIAYHDKSAKYEDLVAKDSYWRSLEPVKDIGNFIVYAKKK